MADNTSDEVNKYGQDKEFIEVMKFYDGLFSIQGVSKGKRVKAKLELENYIAHKVNEAIQNELETIMTLGEAGYIHAQERLSELKTDTKEGDKDDNISE